ncbi:uncharacterized protein LOC134826566 [Bolinopsis microptera]|uniref:uncharacterized protein LOC134826566 n=1 Tax=Bolinopsis microptera TaxID=2820187 RepID=UPI00307B0B6E
MAHRDDYEVTDYIFKVLLIGDKGVGKSSIVRRYVEDRFDTWPTTICVEYGTVTREINGKTVKLQIWDTAGEEKYHCLTDMYYRNTHGVIFVFDLGDPDSLEHVQNTWINQVYAKAPDDVCSTLVGSKDDVTIPSDDVTKSGTRVSLDDIRRVSERYCMSYFSTSAKLNKNIEKLFDHLAEQMMAQLSDYEEIPCPDSLPSFALHSFQAHSPIIDIEEQSGYYCTSCSTTA